MAAQPEAIETFSAIIPAAGSGSRSGRSIPKQYCELLGAPVLSHTLRAFASIDGCIEIIVAIDEAWRDQAERAASGIECVRFVAGGGERQDSIARALRALTPSRSPRGGEGVVLVHDAVRPCVSAEVIRRVVHAAHMYGAAIPVLPVVDTIKRVDVDGRILETVPRSQLHSAQTPQGFRREILERAYRFAAENGIPATDDSSLVEAYGFDVWTVDGAWENLKITVMEDFARAEEILRARGR